MGDVDTLDDLILRLQALKESLGGDTPVRLHSHGRYLCQTRTETVLVGKANPNKTVSRGGRLAVVLCE